ncbi:uncharacterized protein LOC135804413 [Sycon ciliatum]|uniref:uncharacterized protein LOC135804413 n=1 Tax=Sycon ciliatum TaxID=27933 RepID=UPI0031F63021
MNPFEIFAVVCLAFLALPNHDSAVICASSDNLQCEPHQVERRLKFTPGHVGPELISSVASNQHRRDAAPAAAEAQCVMQSISPSSCQRTGAVSKSEKCSTSSTPTSTTPPTKSKKKKLKKKSKKKKKKTKKLPAVSSKHLVMTSLQLKTNELAKYGYASAKVNGSLMLPIYIQKPMTRGMCLAPPQTTQHSLMLYNPQKKPINISLSLGATSPRQCAVRRLVLDECGFTLILPSNTTMELHLKYTPNYSQPIDAHDIHVLDKAGVRSTYRVSAVLPYEVSTQCKTFRDAKESKDREAKADVATDAILTDLLHQTHIMVAIAVALVLVVADLLSRGSLHTACFTVLAHTAPFRFFHRPAKKRPRYKLPKVNLSAQVSREPKSSPESERPAGGELGMQHTNKNEDHRAVASKVAKVKPSVSTRKSQDIATAVLAAAPAKKSSSSRSSHGKGKQHSVVSSDSSAAAARSSQSSAEKSEVSFRRKASPSRKASSSSSKVQTAIVNPVFVVQANLPSSMDPSEPQLVDTAMEELSAGLASVASEEPFPLNSLFVSRDNSFDSMYSHTDTRSSFEEDDMAFGDLDDGGNGVNDMFSLGLVSRSSNTSTDSGCPDDSDVDPHNSECVDEKHDGLPGQKQMRSKSCSHKDSNPKWDSSSRHELGKSLSSPCASQPGPRAFSDYSLSKIPEYLTSHVLLTASNQDMGGERMDGTFEDPSSNEQRLTPKFISVCDDDTDTAELATYFEEKLDVQHDESSKASTPSSPGAIRSVRETVDIALSKTLETFAVPRTQSPLLQTPPTTDKATEKEEGKRTAWSDSCQPEQELHKPRGQQPEPTEPKLPAPSPQPPKPLPVPKPRPQPQHTAWPQQQATAERGKEPLLRRGSGPLCPACPSCSPTAITSRMLDAHIAARRLSAMPMPMDIPMSMKLAQLAVDPFSDVQDAHISMLRRRPTLPPAWRPDGIAARSLVNVQYVPCLPLQHQPPMIPAPAVPRWVGHPQAAMAAAAAAAAAGRSGSMLDLPRGLIPVLPSFSGGVMPAVGVPGIHYPAMHVPLAMHPAYCKPMHTAPSTASTPAPEANKVEAKAEAKAVPEQKAKRPVDIVQEKVDKAMEEMQNNANNIESAMFLWSEEDWSEEKVFPSSLDCLPGDLNAAGLFVNDTADKDDEDIPEVADDDSQEFYDSLANVSLDDGDGDDDDLLRMCFDSIKPTGR